jgi:ribose 5-phosphate isomerase B
MRIALCSDEPYAVHETLTRELERRGHELVLFGSFATGKEEPFALAAEEAALVVAEGRSDEGIFLCWTGTGISIAANKVPGVRAALCTDPGTAKGARIYNRANVLCLSNRTLSGDMAKEILHAWLDTEPGDEGLEGARLLDEVDARHRRSAP